MNTKIVILDEKNIEQNIINEAGRVITEGGLVAFPTETVYGLGANALDKIAVEKIFKAKGRPQDNPLIVHVADFNIGPLVKEIPHLAKQIMDRYWPGPITLIFNKSDLIPETTSAGLHTVGIRMPSSIIAKKLIEAAGTPIAAPSANISGKPSPTDVKSCIEDLSGKIEYILGGNRSEVGIESTIVDCTCTPLCILRPGAITIEMLREIDNKIYIDKNIMSKPESDFVPKAPGMKYRHYAPKAPVKIICGNLEKTIAKINEIAQNSRGNKKIGIMATDETKDKYPYGMVVSLGSRKYLDNVGRNLFEVLRGFDDTDVDLILSEAFEEKGIGVAIMNRLKKSAGFDITNV
ncbi:MAG: L-threonylcarbamoyladenylate synthase [Clostridium sp.]